MKALKKSNANLVDLIQDLRKASIQQDVNVWKRIAEELSATKRNKREVNLYKIAAESQEGEIVVVPGKVLGIGALDKKTTIAAYKFSKSALDKIKESKGTALSIGELLAKNPKGSGIRIIG